MAHQVTETCLIIFAKNPMPNQVKTRLIPQLSPEQAARLYSAFLTDWCETLAALPNATRVIAYTPPESLPDLQALIGKDAIYIPQVGDALGERLISATQWAAEKGYPKILVVGSDSPTLPLSSVSQAIVMLDSLDIVLGPSVDGAIIWSDFLRRTSRRQCHLFFRKSRGALNPFSNRRLRASVQ